MSSVALGLNFVQVGRQRNTLPVPAVDGSKLACTTRTQVSRPGWATGVFVPMISLGPALLAGLGFPGPGLPECSPARELPGEGHASLASGWRTPPAGTPRPSASHWWNPEEARLMAAFSCAPLEWV